jgi:hypothetical protein
MRILDECNNELTRSEIDLEKGYLLIDKIVKMEHEAKPAVEGSGHYIIVKEYENGGKDVQWIWDVEPQPAQEAWTEYEDIQRYILYTEEELKQREEEKKLREQEEANKQKEMEQQINDLQKQLNDLMALIAQMQK